jgi:hypothetical protein
MPLPPPQYVLFFSRASADALYYLIILSRRGRRFVTEQAPEREKEKNEW